MKFARRSFAFVAVLVALAGIITFLPLNPVHATGPTALTPVTVRINNYQVQAGDLVVVPAACDAVNGNSYIYTGQEILMVYNSGGSGYTYTVTPATDAYGAQNTTLSAVAIAAGAFDFVQMSNPQGWITSGNLINLTCSNAAVKFAVLRHS
jgi:hypothetical protein